MQVQYTPASVRIDVLTGNQKLQHCLGYTSLLAVFPVHVLILELKD